MALSLVRQTWWLWNVYAAAIVESGRGCARGIATTDSELGHIITGGMGGATPGQYVFSMAEAVVVHLRRYGMQSIKELVGSQTCWYNFRLPGVKRNGKNTSRRRRRS